MAVGLRPYQHEAVHAIRAGHEDHRRILVSLPTGTGKTRVASHYLKSDFFDRGLSVLWIAHTEELLHQAFQTMTEDFGISEQKVARRYAGLHEDDEKEDAQIFLMNNSVASIACEPDLIIIDEAHHADGVSYKGWLSEFKTFSADGAKLLGLTATPYRLHNGEVTKLTEFEFSRPRVPIFEKLVYKRSFCELAAQGYLAPFHRITFDTNMKFKMSLASGDFSGESLESLNTKARNTFIYEHWRQERSKFGKTLIFVGTKQHARDLAKVFGSDADFVVSGDDDMKRSPRAEIIAKFRHSKAGVLINVGIFREGVDVPDIKTVILARPTASPGLFTQMVGRGARMLPTKSFFYLVDIHDQLDQYETFLVGVNDLADRQPEQLLALTRRAAAAHDLSQGQHRAPVAHKSLVNDLLTLDPNGILTQFGGWAEFRKLGESAGAVALLLPRESFQYLESLCTGTQPLLVSSSLASQIRQAFSSMSSASASDALRRCANALVEGMDGVLHSFEGADSASLRASIIVAAEALGLPSSVDGQRRLAEEANALEQRCLVWQLKESQVALTKQTYMGNPSLFGGALRLSDGQGASYALLVHTAAWPVVQQALDRAKAGQLKFSDGPEILQKLTASDSEASSHGYQILDAIGSGKADDIAFAMTAVKCL